VVAGAFYPADRRVLSEKIDDYLRLAARDGSNPPEPVFGLIAPHAGYDYSGKVAAKAYNAVRNRPYRTVVLLGPTHYLPFEGAAIYPSGTWETPLGRVNIDEAAARAVMRACPWARYVPAAFEREHSLEVQVPFLQKTLDHFRIIPLIMGSMTEGMYSSLTEALLGLVRSEGGRLLIVASSDMSHFHPYEDASRMDRATLRLIEAGDVLGLGRNIERGSSELCGAQAVMALMMVAERLNATPMLRGYENSGDVTADRSRVVGYGAVAFVLPLESSLTAQERKTLLLIARRALEASAAGRALPVMHPESKRLQEKRAVFVTLRKGETLRGCVGCIKPVLSLAGAVSEMAVSAGSRDPRFPPVSAQQVKDIKIEISVLTPLKTVRGVREIQVGKHGLFVARGASQGLLLPQVATEYGWDREELLRQTCAKAGLPPTAWKEKGTEIYSFSAEVFSE